MWRSSSNTSFSCFRSGGGVEKWYAIVDYLQNYQREENKTQPSDAINNALDSFWEQEHGGNGSTKSEELL